jgi:hypothetical protein
VNGAKNKGNAQKISLLLHDKAIGADEWKPMQCNNGLSSLIS